MQVYFPQTNGMLFSFGRDSACCMPHTCTTFLITSHVISANIIWKHGLNALPEDQQKTGKGRVSIILWGQVSDVIEEAGAPPMVPAHSHGGYK
jgi:hypothetical protein